MKMDRGTLWKKANVLMARKRTLDSSIDFVRDTGTDRSVLKQLLNKLDSYKL